MATLTEDLALIKQLEQETGIQLPERPFKDLTKEKKSGYSLNESGEIDSIAIYQVYMTTLPATIVHFKKLEKLVLFNVLATDYSLLKEMGRLSLLDLSYSEIKDISFLAGLTNLTSLYLGGNRISDISFLSQLTGLAGLDLRSNGLVDISPLQKLKKLRTLDLQYNELTNISPLQGLNRLSYLNVNWNKIADLSPLRGLSNLTYLQLAGNQINDIAVLKELGGLVYLNVSNNQIKDITPLRTLNDLSILVLNGNLITDISSIQELKNVRDLDLSVNKIADISPLQSFTQLKELRLSTNQITDISPLQSLTLLNVLHLSKNQITDISPLQAFTQLNFLWLSDNQITDISPLQFLTQLKKLRLSSNQITDIFSLQSLTQLENLTLGTNQIENISPLQALTKLMSLRIAKNKIVDISPLSRLTRLTRLWLDDNEIIDIFPLTAKTNWNILNLRNNRIIKLPSSFASGKIKINWKDDSSAGITLYNNPLEVPPVEIVKQGTPAVRHYFEQLDKGSTLLLESKLIIVGQGEVGKTTLMRKLLNNDFLVVPNQEPTTHGIKIEPWSVSCSLENDSEPQRDITLSIWDFGGQAIYHSTHQFFLTKRSLYLFVWEARKEEEIGSFDYWLNVIKLLSNNSPVIVVMNKADVRQKVIDEASYKNTFPNIVRFIPVSCVTGLGIDVLTKTIHDTLAQMSHLKDLLPKVWLDVRPLLHQEQKNYIPSSRFYDICNTIDLQSHEANIVGEYLHDLGTILYFQKDALLKDIVILNPEWATEAVYKLIDTKEIIENKGRFSGHLLPNIWDQKDYPADKYPTLMRLMEKFELCFRVLDSEDYIIPELVPAKRPDIDFPSFQSPHALKLQFRFAFMPAGIVSRFIARNHYLIDNEKYWQNGVQLIYEESTALILGDPVKRLLTVSVFGPAPTQLLHIIRNQLLHIYLTLNMNATEGHYSEEVPCNCHQCTTSPTEHYAFPFQVLKKTAEQNQMLMCYKSYLPVSPAQLLKGYQPPQPAATLSQTLIHVLSGLQGIAGHMRTEEDSRTAFLAELLRVRGYFINEQAPRGRSQAGLDLGQLDMEIRGADGKQMAILEAFNLKYLDKKVISDHVQKIFGYDASGLKENYILVYGESAQFNDLWRKYLDYLPQVPFPYPLIGKIDEQHTDYAEIKSARSRHRRNDTETVLIHLFVNLSNRPQKKKKKEGPQITQIKRIDTD